MGLEIGCSRVGADETVEVAAAFLIDATGPGGALTRAFGVPTDPDDLLTNSWSVYSHFEDVARFEDCYRSSGGDADAHPYRCDDAALHHVLADGWVFVLRFNNDLVSAGPVLDGTRRRLHEDVTPEAEWEAVRRRYPSVAAQFAAARSVRPFVRTGRLQRRARRAVGPGWALLPHAAYFLDPLYSGGNAHTLLGVERLGRLVRDHWGRPALDAGLADYERVLFREVAFLDRLIHGSYQTFGRFDLLAPYTMYYFAGAIHSEGRRRRGEAGPGDEFLFSHDPAFRAALGRRTQRWGGSSVSRPGAARRISAGRSRATLPVSIPPACATQPGTTCTRSCNLAHRTRLNPFSSLHILKAHSDACSAGRGVAPRGRPAGRLAPRSGKVRKSDEEEKRTTQGGSQEAPHARQISATASRRGPGSPRVYGRRRSRSEGEGLWTRRFLC